MDEKKNDNNENTNINKDKTVNDKASGKAENSAPEKPQSRPSSEKKEKSTQNQGRTSSAKKKSSASGKHSKKAPQKRKSSTQNKRRTSAPQKHGKNTPSGKQKKSASAKKSTSRSDSPAHARKRRRKKPLFAKKNKRPVLKVVEGTGGNNTAAAGISTGRTPNIAPVENNTPKTSAERRGRPRPPKKTSGVRRIKAMAAGRKGPRSFIKDNKISIAAISAIVVLLVFAFIFSSRSVTRIGEKQVMFSKEYSMSSKADFSVLGDNIFYVSKDGMLFLGNDGNPIWTDTFTMSAPFMLCDGDYAAVADSGGKIVNVYNKEGKLYQISAAGPITTFAVNPLGCCAIVCKVNEDYRVDVYSNTGEAMFECARASKDGVPLGIDISDDGTVVALTLVNYYNDININSSVLFYYTVKSEAQTAESSDGLISAIEVPEAMAGIVRFMPDNHCVVASDKSLIYIDCTASKNKDNQTEFSKEWEKTFTNYITAIDIVNNREIAVAFGESISVVDEDAIAQENTVHWYNLRGREKSSAKSEERVTGISSSDKGTIVTAGKDYTAYDLRGKELWSYRAIQNVSGMLFYNSEDRVVLITPTNMRILDVKKGTKMQEEETEVTAEEKEETEQNEEETEQIQEENKQNEEETKASSENEKETEAVTQEEEQTEKSE